MPHAPRPSAQLCSIVLALLASAPLLATSAAAETTEQCIKQLVCLRMSWNQDEAIIYADNRSHVPIGVRMVFQNLDNLAPLPRLTQRNVAERVVQPKTQKAIQTLIRQSMKRGASLPFTWTMTFGDPNVRHDDSYAYRMPFGGQAERVLTQGANGSFSHTGESAWAFDFAMPVGTPIVAAREGIVIERNDGYTESGISSSFLDKANAVTVMHGDGTFATYAHLDAGSGVREGMRVSVGDVLGFSGNTGFSTGPHLHFSVWKALWKGGETIPISFWDVERRRAIAGASLSEMEHYPPTCHARGGKRCRAGELPSGAVAAPDVGNGAGAAGVPAGRFERTENGACRCANGATISTHLPCRAVCP